MPRIRTRNITVYLLKESVGSVINSLRESSGFDEYEDYSDSNGGVLYFKHNHSNPCWWSNYLGIDTVYNYNYSAAYFLQCNNRIFVFCFGQGRYAVKEELFVEDFGHKAALNALDPKKIKKGITYLPEHTGKSQATQVSTYTTLSGLGYDGYSNILKNIAGKTKEEYSELILNVEGASSLRIGTKVQKNDLPNIAEKLLELYAQDIDAEAFPDIDKIKIIKDKEVTQQLDLKLMEMLQEKDEEVSIVVPEFFGESDVQFIQYNGIGNSNEYPELDINDLYELLETDHIWDVTHLKQYSVRVQLNNFVQEYKLKKCLVCETDIGSSKYYLYNEQWYQIKVDFVSRISSEIADYNDQSFLTLDYSHDNENAYNQVLAEMNNWRCFDGQNPNIVGYSRVEVCDLYDDANMRLVHVKLKHDKSAPLSHLFFQGVVSKDLILARHEKIQEFFRNKSIDYPDPKKMKIHYVIIGKPSKRSGEVTIPLFSKISLWHAIKSFQNSQVDVSWSTVRNMN